MHQERWLTRSKAFGAYARTNLPANIHHQYEKHHRNWNPNYLRYLAQLTVETHSGGTILRGKILPAGSLSTQAVSCEDEARTIRLSSRYLKQKSMVFNANLWISM